MTCRASREGGHRPRQCHLQDLSCLAGVPTPGGEAPAGRESGGPAGNGKGRRPSAETPQRWPQKSAVGVKSTDSSEEFTFFLSRSFRNGNLMRGVP